MTFGRAATEAGPAAGFKLLAWLAMGLTLAATAGAQAPQTGSPEAALHRAQAFYWVGVEQQGLLRTFDRAVGELDRAEAELATAVLEPEQRRRLRLQIESLREEIDGQYARVRPSFNGVFPLARLINPTLFKDARVMGAYELVTRPARVAVGKAARESLTDIVRVRHPHVVVTSRPADPELEAEAISVFALGTRPRVHSRSELSGLLTEAQLEQLDSGAISPEIKDALLTAFDAIQLLVLEIHEEAVIEGDYLYMLEGKYFTRDSPCHVDGFARRGIARDRRDQLLPLIWTNVGLLLLSLALYPAVARLHGRHQRTLGALALTGAATFVMGRLLAWVVMPLLYTVRPAPDAPALLSWWWPALLGLVLVALPGLVGWIMAMRVKRLFFVVQGERAVGAIYGVGTLGVCAYLAGPLLILDGSAGFQSLVPLMLAACGLANILGGASRTGPPVAPFFAGGPLLLAPLLGLALLHARPGPLWAVALAAAVLTLVVVLHYRLIWKDQIVEDEDEEAAYREDEKRMKAVEEELTKKLL